jgi:hypothetical protein
LWAWSRLGLRHYRYAKNYYAEQNRVRFHNDDLSGLRLPRKPKITSCREREFGLTALQAMEFAFPTSGKLR